MEKSPFKILELPEPWYWTSEDLSIQLQTELNNDHILKGELTKTTARRQDNDDVLFEIKDGKYAIVHLTWQKYPHENTMFPLTEIYENWKNVFGRILNDAESFL